MSLLGEKKKDEQARSQNSAAAMLGQAPTAQGGDMGGALMGGLQQGLQQKAPGQDAIGKIEGRAGGSAMGDVDDLFGGKKVEDEDLLEM